MYFHKICVLKLFAKIKTILAVKIFSQPEFLKIILAIKNNLFINSQNLKGHKA